MKNLSKNEKFMLASVGFSTLFIFAVIIFVFLVSGFTNPQSEKKEDTMLWEISGNGLEKPSYLFGTIHIICSDDFAFPNGFEQAFDKTEQVALELDMDDPSLIPTIQQVSVMPDGMHLKKLLEEDKYNTVAQFFADSLGIPTAQFEAMGIIKPIILSSLTLQKAIACPTKGYETEIVAKAVKDQKEILGVETVQDQFGAFDKTPFEEQAEMLYEGITDFGKGSETLRQLMAAYKSQSVEKTYEMIKANSAEYENFEQDMLIDRNIKWIPVMEDMAKEKPTLFAVGSGHLGGEQGVINLLREAGYKVSPVL